MCSTHSTASLLSTTLLYNNFNFSNNELETKHEKFEARLHVNHWINENDKIKNSNDVCNPKTHAKRYRTSNMEHVAHTRKCCTINDWWWWCWWEATSWYGIRTHISLHVLRKNVQIQSGRFTRHFRLWMCRKQTVDANGWVYNASAVVSVSYLVWEMRNIDLVPTKYCNFLNRTLYFTFIAIDIFSATTNISRISQQNAMLYLWFGSG